MIRGTLAALAIAGFFAVGCDNSEPAGSSTEVKDAQKEVGKEAAGALEKTQDVTQDATKAAKDAAGNAEAAAKDGASAVQSAVDDLISKAKDACKDAKWSDAENYVKQIEEKKSLLPADYQPKVDSALAEVKKLIEGGKKLAAPAMPK